MNTFLQKKSLFVLYIFIVIGVLLRFYNLNWGAPYYFHPDERNIASAITQLQFPSQMNPHFFAYGSFPLYLVYFANLLLNYLKNCALIHHFPLAICHSSFTNTVTFEQAILGLRVLSATLSVLLIPLLFYIGKKLKNELVGLLAAFFAMTSIGFIQYSHFGTYEMFLTYFTALLFYVCLRYIEHPTKINVVYLSIVAGFLISSKITNFIFLPIPILLFFLIKRHHVNKASHKSWLSYIHFVIRPYVFTFCYLLFSFSIFIATNPFIFNSNMQLIQESLRQHHLAFITLFNPDFINSMQYESSVALGSEAVFYTGDFFNTQPVLYQAKYVLPFLLTPFLMIFVIPAIGYLVFKSITSWNKKYIFLFLFLGITFFPQAFLFVKWTRYMVPTLPFFYSTLAIFIIDVIAYIHIHAPHKRYMQWMRICIGIGGCISLLYAYAFFMTVYVEPDTRVAAATFAQKHIPSNAPIISEVYDLGITAFNADFSNITLFNFYDLDNNSPISSPSALSNELQTTDYIILPSQRILKMRLPRAKKFPNGNAFYTHLFNGTLGFQKIYETPCDIWCTITYAEDPVATYEETATVFDRPTVYIFKKVNK